jgi:hypothetical protein
MRQGRSITEHSAERASSGIRFYHAAHPWNALVGLRVLGEPARMKRVSSRPTLVVDLGNTDVGLEGTLRDRVWFVCRHVDGPRLHGISVGRSMDNDVVIPDYSISMRHCEFLEDPEGLRVVDRGALNRTRVDGELLQANTPLLLRDGQSITLGRFEFQFLLNPTFLQRLAPAPL